MGGYIGKILKVDLTQGKVEIETLEDGFYRKWLGGYGLGVKIIYSEITPKAGPMEPGNIVGLTTGILTGTLVPFSGSFTAVGKSPLTGGWGDSRGGGFFGSELKQAGFDAIFFYGRSEKPVYLWIKDGKAEIMDASDLWGKTVIDTENTLKQKHNDEKIQVASIGPAGEKLSLSSAIMTDEGRAAGRSGLAAVMGSKNLKAVAVRGTRDIPVADDGKLRELRKKVLELTKANPGIIRFRKYGMCGGTAETIFSGDCPVKNWGGVGEIDFPTAAKIGGPAVIKYDIGHYACFNCPVACGGLQRVESGPYAVQGHKPEYETLGSFGAMSLNDDVESIIYLNHICNNYGLDTIEVGSTVAFAIECYENGLISKKDTDNVELTWGNTKSIVEMTEKIAKREGFGDLLADGVKIASERIGKGSEQYAMHVGGQAMPMHDPRQMYTSSYNRKNALMYVADATPGRHTQSPHEGFAKQATGLCSVNGMMIGAGDAPGITDFINAVTGWSMNPPDMVTIGDRIATMRQAFNAREGLKPSDFKYPDRVLGKPPFKSGMLTGVTIEKQVKELVEEYFKSMDWSLETGKPSRKKLQELGLEDEVREL